MPDSALLYPFQPIDALETSLVDSWQAVSRATHRFFRLLREFDLRQGWKAYGNTDCAEWLDWRCGICRNTAQEKVRIARALWSLPAVDEAFENGGLSYSKVRAVTRVATQRNERELLHYASRATASQVEAYCRRLRNGDAEVSSKDAMRIHEGRSLSRHFREDGSALMTVELPREDMELVLKALELVGGSLPEDPTRSLFAAGADALVHMAREALGGGSESAGNQDNYQVVVHVDASALQGEGGEADLPLTTMRRLCCDGGVVPLVERDDGKPLNVGRKQRTVPTGIKRALLARDRRCTYPGCHHERFVDAHHIVHWSEGGETSLDNLTLVCTHHHRLLHEGGYSIQRHRDGRHYFARPDGRPVEPRGSIAGHQVQEPMACYRVRSSSAEEYVSAAGFERFSSRHIISPITALSRSFR